MAIKTRNHKYMALALQRVEEVEGLGGETAGRYQKYCQNFPVMVRQNGLIRAVAFALSKAGERSGQEKAYARIAEDVAKILEVEHGAKGEGLMEKIISSSASEYMLMTQRVLDAWVYFKRFSKSVLVSPQAEDKASEEVGGGEQ